MSPTLVLWLHLSAAMILIGGLIAMRVVVRPVLKAAGPESRSHALMQQMGRRFRTLSWVCVVTLVLTGSFNLLNAGASERIETDWGVILMIKLFAFAILVGLLLIHDFVLDPYRETSPVGSLKKPPRSFNRPMLDVLQGAIIATGLIVLFLAAYLAAL
ncbi:MAG: DUF4149 domain-containing protein [Nitrospirae bacterium]|nr:MAG: DUF4149 domain-containing protein [Nitrospirota bacterium]